MLGFDKNKSVLKTQAELQSYIDKKLDAFFKKEKGLSRDQMMQTIRSMAGQIESLNNKHKRLVAHLGLEYKEEMTKGYVKVKKTKKK